MEEWKEYKLGDLIVLSSGGTPNKSNSSYWDGDIPWISAKAMYDDYLYTSDITITREGLNHGSKLAPVNSILLLTRGSGLFNRIPVCLVKREMAFNQDVKCIESKDKNVVSNIFLFYWLMGHKREISNILETTGIGAGKIDTERLKNLSISLPPIQTQLVLIKFAESLILKIEVNRRINENLEQQAQALFKSWFVDFEPFKNGEFVESELGMIPKGWRVISIGDLPLVVTDYVANGSFASLKENVKLYQEEEYAVFIRNTDLKSGEFCVYVDKHSYDFLSKSRLYGGEIIISNVGDVGSVYLCPHLNKPMTLGNNIIMVKSEEEAINVYLYILFRWSYGQGLIQSITGGSAQPKFNKTDFKSLKVIMPSNNILVNYGDKMLSMMNIIEANKVESRRLAELRDTLLPKLMSGELKVSEIVI